MARSLTGVYTMPFLGNPGQANCWPLVSPVLPNGFLDVNFKAPTATENENKATLGSPRASVNP